MKIKYKLFFVLVVNILLIAVIGYSSYSSMRKINAEVSSIIADPTSSILKIDALSRVLLLSVEDAFAYPLLGEVEHKEKYYEHSKKFNKELGELKQLAESYSPEAKLEAAELISGVTQEQANFDRDVKIMFANYEATKTMNIESVARLNEEVNQIIPLLDQFASMESDEIKESGAKSQEATDAAVGLMFTILSMALVGSIVVNGYIIYSITGPLRILGEAAEDFGRGNYKKRADFASSDEFGALTSSFNAMASNIQRTQEKLDAEVAERTEELDKKNKELTQKNKELEETLDDFYTLRIGMTEDMAGGNLKEENEKIRERLYRIKNKAP